MPWHASPSISTHQALSSPPSSEHPRDDAIACAGSQNFHPPRYCLLCAGIYAWVLTWHIENPSQSRCPKRRAAGRCAHRVTHHAERVVVLEPLCHPPLCSCFNRCRPRRHGWPRIRVAVTGRASCWRITFRPHTSRTRGAVCGRKLRAWPCFADGVRIDAAASDDAGQATVTAWTDCHFEKHAARRERITRHSTSPPLQCCTPTLDAPRYKQGRTTLISIGRTPPRLRQQHPPR